MAAMVCIAGIAGILVYSIVVANQLTGLIGLGLATVLAFYCIRADLGLLWIIFGLTLAFEAGVAIRLAAAGGGDEVVAALAHRRSLNRRLVDAR